MLYYHVHHVKYEVIFKNNYTVKSLITYSLGSDFKSKPMNRHESTSLRVKTLKYTRTLK